MSQGSAENETQQRLARWVQEHGAAVRGFLLALTRRLDLADDLSQEVFRRALTAKGYQEEGKARSYLIRIADRLARDEARRRPAETLQPEGLSDGAVCPDPAPDARMMQDETRQELHAALDLLSPAQRRVLLLRFYSQMSFQEIADQMDTPLSTVLSHCRRGLLAMRKLLEGNPSL